MKFLSVTLSLIVIVQFAYCQGYQQGLIILKNSDTIICSVPRATTFGDKVSIYLNDGKKQTILVQDIKYLATASSVYENIEFIKKGKNQNKLMQIKIEGKINLYLEVIVNET